jgi:hypothetical protein
MTGLATLILIKGVLKQTNSLAALRAPRVFWFCGRELDVNLRRLHPQCNALTGCTTSPLE